VTALPVVVPALLAAASVAVLLGTPTPADLRLRRWAPARRAPRWSPDRAVRALGRSRREQDERARAVEACAVLASELRAGRAPHVALLAAAEVASGPTADALAAGAATAAVGGDVGPVLTRVDGSAAPELLRGLGACWSVCAGTGSGLASAVERLEEAQRDVQARRRAVRAELAGPRATARLLAGLPLLGIALASALGAAPLQVLLHTTVGRVCLVLGTALDALGVLWTRRTARRAEGSAGGAPS
jgi:tight adherence protein B